MKSKPIAGVVVFMIAGALVGGSYAEVICFKNGKTIDAKIVSTTADSIQVDVGTTPITYYLDEVASIDGKPVASAVAPLTQETSDAGRLAEKRVVPVILKAENYEITPRLKEETSLAVNIVYSLYREWFGFEYPDDFEVKVRIFDSLDLFERFQMKRYGKIISHTGVYMPDLKECLVWKNTDKSSMLSLILHETNHALFDAQVSELPKWIDEGASEFFSALYVDKGALGVTWVHDWDAWCKYKVRYEKQFDIRKYLVMSEQEWADANASSGGRAYDIAWSMAAFMMSSPQRRDILKNMFSFFNEYPHEARRSIMALEKYYRGGVDQFDKDWRAWVLEPRKDLILFDSNAKKN